MKVIFYFFLESKNRQLQQPMEEDLGIFEFVRRAP
jgi:hypothetical protein